MNKFTALSLLTSSALLLSACASTPTQTLAIQKADNQYEVTGLGKDQITAKNNAIVAANKTCGKKAAPVLINEKTEYHGSLNGVVDEQTGKMITAAAGVIGSVMGKNYGIEKDTDYQSTLTFSCKAN
ncbi:hypothetical protein KTH93_05650 [Acinetobacter bereziniae]|uniref:hypothetical protein n=1 Tax=Acinetobacter bereziniae TaxID=106648 RepID=UPI0021D232C8|nr:hypothetical protein [Acinetobacter bereziniae]MCU4434962.1 hypothetical protein [Acinetobacter bereziniae]